MPVPGGILTLLLSRTNIRSHADCLGQKLPICRPPGPEISNTASAQVTKAAVAPSPSLLGRLRGSRGPPDPLEIKRQQEARRLSKMANFLENLE